jgi:CBS domain-containing protein
MTSPALTIAPDATVVEAARSLDRHEVAGEVLTDYVGTNPALVDVSVTEGVVTLPGRWLASA